MPEKLRGSPVVPSAISEEHVSILEPRGDVRKKSKALGQRTLHRWEKWAGILRAEHYDMDEMRMVHVGAMEKLDDVGLDWKTIYRWNIDDPRLRENDRVALIETVREVFSGNLRRRFAICR